MYLALATSEAAFQQEIKKLGIPDGDAKFPNGSSLARVIELQREGGGRIARMCLVERGVRSKIDMIGTIVHESLHVWQIICEYIGETSPSREFEAYSVQGIVTTLIESYERQTGERLT